MTDTFDLTEAQAEKPAKKSKSGSQTVLERLREKLEVEIKNDNVQLEVPKRPSVTIIVSPNIEQADLKRWRKSSGEDQKGGFDPNKFARTVIAQTCKGFVIDGEEVFTDEGAPVTFASPFIKEWLDALDPLQAVKKLYVLDPHMEAAAMSILDASGYGDEVNIVDPTKLS